jgi:hypothetical protein
MRQEGTNGTRNRDVKEQLRLGNERTRRRSTGSPLDWKSQSELPDVVLGLKESKIGPCGGVDPS